MRIYLDVCSLNRPLDDLSQERVRLEAQAVVRILELIKAGVHELVDSEALRLETKKTSDSAKREYVMDVLALAVEYHGVHERIHTRSRELEAMGFKALDALHVACAESAGAFAFLTTDDRLLRRAKKVQ